MGTKKSERIFWTLLTPAQPSYTALTGPETAICEPPRAGDRKSDQFCHHSIPPNSPLVAEVLSLDATATDAGDGNTAIWQPPSTLLRQPRTVRFF